MSKRKGIGGTVKRDVWLKYVGNKAETKCFCCKKNVIMLCSGVHNTPGKLVILSLIIMAEKPI